jgi:hypothetical protein
MPFIKLNNKLIKFNGDFLKIAPETRFIITVDTTKSGSSSDTFVLPTTGPDYDFMVDWGDNTSSNHSGTPGNISHQYPASGTYIIKILGAFPRIYFNNTGDRLKLMSIDNWGIGAWSSMERAFFGCTNLANLASDGIKCNGTIMAFHYTFFSCASISNIPENLFRYSTLVTESAFSHTFFGCTSISNIPENLFRYNTLVSLNAFSNTFNSCNTIKTIPVGLFRYNELVSSNAFYRTFRNCNSLTTIPNDLFKFNTLALSFYQCFYGCVLLETAPNYLFRYNILVNNFSYTFYGCYKLQLNKYIFYAEGEQSTRFLNMDVNFSSFIQRVSFTGIQGEAPDLWNCNFGTGTLTKTLCFNGGGNSLTSINNYNDIPVEWL